MATCATCNKTFTFGGVKDGDVRYCSVLCRFNGFFAKLDAALTREAAANPQPFPFAAPIADNNAPPSEEPGGSIAVDAGKDMMVMLLGSGVAVAVAILIYFLVDLIGYPFHAQTIWFVIPIGGLLCGLVAGSGFWLALRIFNRLPTAGTYLAAGGVGVLSYVMIYFMMWWLFEFQGVKIRDQVGFVEFLQQVIEHQRVRFLRGQGQGFEVGKWGYARFAISLVGFAAGVVTMVAIGGGKAYCPRCKRYLKNVAKQNRATSDPEALAVALHPVIAALATGHIQEALDLHAVVAGPKAKGYWTTTITVEACPGCGMHLANLTASIPGDQGAQVVEGFVFQGANYYSVPLIIS